MSIEYLGNKTKLLDFVLRPILAQRDVATVADVFCGTASVSRALAGNGLRVVAGDHLHLCVTLAEAALLAPKEPPFLGLRAVLQARHRESMHEATLRHLNELAPEAGFFHATYSPASRVSGHTRMYLTETNAARVDAIRSKIDEWATLLSRPERAILLAALIAAVARVSNTAGTYGCYLKKWKDRSMQPLHLQPARSTGINTSGHEVYLSEASELVPAVDVDAVYLDPPYTKRQYAAYYHLLETLASGARPMVTGSTGLPPWREKQSDFCYGRRAASALRSLVASVRARHLFLSYSEDGHVPHSEILSILRERGETSFSEHRMRRYRSNDRRHLGAFLTERLYHVVLTA